MNTELSLALVALAATGQRPRCGDLDTRDRWTSDDAADREWAAYQCKGCPLADPCLREALATRTTWGVWGGHDLGLMSKASRSRLRTKLEAANPDPTESLF